MNVATILYSDTTEKDIDIIRPLWAQLNEHHRVLSPHFAYHYEKFTFEERREDLLNKARGGLMHIGLAKDIDAGRYVGYCVSSVVGENGRRVGEVDSIFVEKAYRANGIGDKLMRKALEWMDAEKADTKKVSVGAGNEGVFPFYARFGFHTRMTTLEQVPKKLL